MINERFVLAQGWLEGTFSKGWFYRCALFIRTSGDINDDLTGAPEVLDLSVHDCSNEVLIVDVSLAILLT